MTRLLRAVTRPLKRLARPLRLWWIDYQIAASEREKARLRMMREGFVHLERNEDCEQVRLKIQRDQIEKGLV